jgi:large subunit ribosomal protein L29
MEFKDMKDLSNTELKKKQKTLTSDLFTAKMKNSLGQLSNPLEIRHLRRELAQLKTAVSQKAAAERGAK